jgi:hypothetical protein
MGKSTEKKQLFSMLWQALGVLITADLWEEDEHGKEKQIDNDTWINGLFGKWRQLCGRAIDH